MYLPAAFASDDIAAKRALIAACPLGLLISAGPDGPMADPLPFRLEDAADGTLKLVAHLARANPQAGHLDGARVLVSFQGPAHYVTPSWYPSKTETHRVVPTWNYAAVQVEGIARLIDDAAEKLRLVGRLTAAHEAKRTPPWRPDDAPAEFIAMQLRAIVGLEIAVEAMTGKWKMSQNRTPAERDGVVNGLSDETGEQAAAVRALVASPPAGRR